MVEARRGSCVRAGYYGASESQTFSEASSSGRDYLAEVCRDWEAEAERSTAKRNVVLRTGASPTHPSTLTPCCLGIPPLDSTCTPE